MDKVETQLTVMFFNYEDKVETYLFIHNDPINHCKLAQDA